MPEGPSIVILKEAVQEFKNQKVIHASGNSQKIDTRQINGQHIVDFKSWGKHFLICFSKFAIRIHFTLLGSYHINERKPSEASMPSVRKWRVKLLCLLSTTDRRTII